MTPEEIARNVWLQHVGGPVDFPVVGEYRECEHGYQHPPWPHSCDGCYCDDERDERQGWTPLVRMP